MANPSFADFDFAIADAIDGHGNLFRIQIQDDEYKKGRVEKRMNKTSAGTLVEPFALPGGFATVYKFKTRRGELVAFRVYRREVEPDTQYRYEKIGPYFKKHAPEITAEFRYFNNGLKVGDGSNMGIFPVVIMTWVEGATLIQAVDQLCQKRDRSGLAQLSQQWAQLVRAMNAAKFAHGDLSGGNIMVRPDGRMVLVDYDGVFIPEFAGRNAIVGGTPDYLHPLSSKRAFDERMDDFSALAIYTALLALAVKPELWDTSGIKRAKDGKPTTEHLLFQSADFEKPDLSAILKQLSALTDPDVQAMVGELRKACKQPVRQVRLPALLVDPDLDKKQALTKLEQALAKGDDQEIAPLWTSLLQAYPPAQKHRTRAEQAIQHLAALDKFIKALATNDDEQIVQNYDSLLDQSPKLTQAQRDRLADAKKRLAPYKEFIAALTRRDELALVKVYDMHAQVLSSHPKISKQEKDQVDLARQCIKMRDQVRVAMFKQDEEAIAIAYNKNLVRDWSFLPPEIPLIEQALKHAQVLREFQEALDKAEDGRAKQIYEANQDWLKGHKALDKKLKRVEEAIQRETTLQLFRRAVYKGEDAEVVRNAALLPRGYARFTNDDQKALAMAQARIGLRQAIQSSDDEKIVAAAAGYDKLAPPFYQLDAAEKQRILDARQNVLALQDLNEALKKDDDSAIQNAYEAKRAFFDASPLLTASKKDRIQLAHDRLDDLNALWEAIKKSEDKQIVALAAKPTLVGYAKLSPRDLQQIEQARAREKLRAALATGDDLEIYANYDAKTLPQFEGLSPQETDCVKRVVGLYADWEALSHAIQTDNDEVIAKLYKRELEGFAALTDEQKKRATLAQERFGVFCALREEIDRGDDEKIVALADRLPSNYPKLTAVEQRRIAGARTLVADLIAYRGALRQNDDEQVLARFTSALQNYSRLTDAERGAPAQAQARLDHYNALASAITSGDDDKIEKFGRLLSNYRKITTDQRQRIEQAAARVQAALHFRRALAAFQAQTQDERNVAEAYDSILDSYSGLQPFERALLKQCQEVIAMPARVRAALQSDNDEKIKAAFVADQTRSWNNFTKMETDRIQLAYERLAALTRLRKALMAENDTEIAANYIDLLHNYAALIPAERKRIELAIQRTAILKKLEVAIQGGNEHAIVDAYDPRLEPSKLYTTSQRNAVAFARRVLQMPEQVRAAIRADDERAIVAAYDAALDRAVTDLNASERERIRHAQAYVRFVDSLATGDDETISKAYNLILDTSSKISEAQRNQFAHAQKRWAAWLKFRQALDSGDEKNIFDAYDPILAKSPYMTPEVQTQFRRAVKCAGMRREFQDAILTNDDRKIAAAYDPTLVRDFNRPTEQEQKRIELAIQRVALLSQLEQAIAAQNDAEILKVPTNILQDSINFTPELRRRVAEAQTRDGALEQFLQAVGGNDDLQVINAYNPTRLDNYARVPQAAHERLTLARTRSAAVAAFELAVKGDNDETILAVYARERALLESSSAFGMDLRDRLALAQQRTNALVRLREAINSGDEWRVLKEYDGYLLDGYTALTQWDRSSLERAKRVVESYARLEQALAQDDHVAITAAYDPQMLSRAKPLAELQQKRIQLALRFMETKRQIESALQQNSVARAIQIERASQLFVRSIEFDAAKRDYLAPLDAKNVTAKIHKQEIQVKWEWPSAPAPSHALVIWHTDKFVEAPEPMNPNARIVERGDGQTQASVTFVIGTHWQYFVRVFSAIPVDNQGARYEFVFSAGQEATSRIVARRPVRVAWRLTKRKGSAQNELELRTDDGTPLPQLIIVRQQHHLPMSKSDGAYVAQVPDAISRASNPKQVLVPLEVSKWARHTILRVFPADDAQADIISIVGGAQGVKIEVN